MLERQIVPQTRKHSVSSLHENIPIQAPATVIAVWFICFQFYNHNTSYYDRPYKKAAEGPKAVDVISYIEKKLRSGRNFKHTRKRKNLKKRL